MLGLVERLMVDPGKFFTYVLVGRRISKSPILEVCLSFCAGQVHFTWVQSLDLYLLEL